VIRIPTGDGWILVRHPDHADLAGRIGSHWGNEEFLAPEPRKEALVAVFRHDDAWATRDSEPFITSKGLPGAFSRELVGAYSAFEEIDFADYLAVRACAAECVASESPYAAAVISMHTVDLLTTRADWGALAPADRRLLADFIGSQRRRQGELLSGISGDPAMFSALSPSGIARVFEFLQACDSLSLTACVRYPGVIPLRHRHPRKDGSSATILCTPLGADTYRLSPYPLDEDGLVLEIPCRRVEGLSFETVDDLRKVFKAAPIDRISITLVK
jgi:hypothetical protein